MEGNEKEAPSAIGAANPPVLPPIAFCPTLIGTTPGVRESSCVKLRPFSGRSFTSLVAITVPNSAEDACNCSVDASTLTTSDAAPTDRDTSIVAVWLTASWKAVTSFVEKPDALTFKVYCPGL